MKAAQFYVGFVVVVMAFGFEGCDSNSSNGSNKTTGRTSTGDCPASSSSSSSESCTGQDAYDACLQQACGAQYQTCLGPSYLTGSYSGTCKTEIECILGCTCGDTACELGCYNKASSACVDCYDAMGTCETQSGCVEPVCGTTGAGGTSSTGTNTGQGGTSSTGTATGQGGTSSTSVGDGGSTATGSGGTTASVCPYTTTNFDCTAACTNLKSIAAKCQSDPALSADIQAVLSLAANGTGTACKASCAAASPTAPNQWKCYQAVPNASDCTAIAGCTYTNCPP